MEQDPHKGDIPRMEYTPGSPLERGIIGASFKYQTERIAGQWADELMFSSEINVAEALAQLNKELMPALEQYLKRISHWEEKRDSAYFAKLAELTQDLGPLDPEAEK